MVDLATLQSARDNLVLARVRGIRTVRDSNGEEITYASDREMANALAALDREIAAQSGRQPKTIIFRTSKGL